MNRDYTGRGNACGGCGSCGMPRGNDCNDHNDRNNRNDRNDRNNRNQRNDGDGCGICNLFRGDVRGDKPRCSDAQAAKWMRRLQVLDFALQELVLYLDMYPDCHRALAKFHTLREERTKVVKMLEASGTSITACGNESRERWDWIDGPWPWEYDFSGNAKD